MARLLVRFLLVLAIIWLTASLALGLGLLPPLLLAVPVPTRTPAVRDQVLAGLRTPGDHVTWPRIAGGEGRTLQLVHLHRPRPRGVVIYLHGFGDDAWGTLGRAEALPEWDALAFTFRGRDLIPAAPCTLGAWERQDVVAACHYLEGEGMPPGRIILAGWSMGAGVALLALEDLEREGRHLGGALLECPFEDLDAATRDHLRGTLGRLEILARPAARLALWRAGRMAHFDPARVSPAEAARHVTCPLAFITGEADRETPVAGVRRVAEGHADLTVVPGAGHCEASNRLPGGWGTWARARLEAWGHAGR